MLCEERFNMNRYNNFIEAVTNKAAMKYMLTEDNNSFINLQKKVNCSFVDFQSMVDNIDISGLIRSEMSGVIICIHTWITDPNLERAIEAYAKCLSHFTSGKHGTISYPSGELRFIISDICNEMTMYENNDDDIIIDAVSDTKFEYPFKKPDFDTSVLINIIKRHIDESINTMRAKSEAPHAQYRDHTKYTSTKPTNEAILKQRIHDFIENELIRTH